MKGKRVHIRAFRPLYMARSLVTGGLENHAWSACPRRGPGLLAHLAWGGLGGGMVFSIWSGVRPVALASALPLGRSAPVWEVTALLATRRRAGAVMALLEGLLPKRLARRGAERVLLRLERPSPLVEMLTQTGFTVLAHERLYVVEHEGLQEAPAVPTPSIWDLFRLYCRGAPATVRAVMGMTLDRWSATLTPPLGRTQEVFLVGDDGLCAWARVVRLTGAPCWQAIYHPETDPSELARLVALCGDGSRAQRWLVPDYQESLRRTLEAMGARVVREFVLACLPLAVEVRAEHLASVRA